MSSIAKLFPLFENQEKSVEKLNELTLSLAISRQSANIGLSFLNHRYLIQIQMILNMEKVKSS